MKKSFTKFAQGAAVIAILTAPVIGATTAHATDLPDGGVPSTVGYEESYGGCDGTPTCGGSTGTDANANANANASTGDVTVNNSVNTKRSAHAPSVYVGGAGDCSSGWGVSFGVPAFGGGLGHHSPDKECLDQKTAAAVYEIASKGGDVVVAGAALGALRLFDERFNNSSTFVLNKIQDPACLSAAKNVSALVLTGEGDCGAYTTITFKPAPAPVVEQKPVVKKPVHHRKKPVVSAIKAAPPVCTEWKETTQKICTKYDAAPAVAPAPAAAAPAPALAK